MGSDKERIQRKIRVIIDIINVIAGAAVIGLMVYTFLDARNRMGMFPFIFYLGALVNAVTGIKHMLSDKKLQGVATWAFAAALVLAGYFSGEVG